MTPKHRYSAEEFVLMAAWIDPECGNKARELHEILTQGASTEAQVMGLVEALEKIVEDAYTGRGKAIAKEALSKFQGDS